MAVAWFAVAFSVASVASSLEVASNAFRGAGTGAGGVRYAVELAPIKPPSAGAEFMHGMFLVGASTSLREGGARGVLCRDVDVALSVFNEQLEHKERSNVAVVYSGDLSVFREDSDVEGTFADAALVRCKSGDMGEAWLIETCEALLKQNIAPVLGVEGLGSKEELEEACVKAKAQGAEALFVIGEEEQLGKGLSRMAVPVVRCLDFKSPLSPSELEAIDGEAYQSAKRGYDAIVLMADPLATPRTPAELSASHVEAIKTFKSKRSRAFGGGWSSNSGAFSNTAEQDTAVGWAKMIESQVNAGIYSSFEEGKPSQEAAAAPVAEAPPADESAARQAALATLKEKDGWNK